MGTTKDKGGDCSPPFVFPSVAARPYYARPGIWPYVAHSERHITLRELGEILERRSLYRQLESLDKTR